MPIEKTCKQCGNGFKVKPKEATRKFCCRDCHRAYETAHGREAATVPSVSFQCATCHKPFAMKPAYLRSYHKKFGTDPKYCSISCSAAGRRAETMARSVFTCKNCGAVTPMAKYQAEGRVAYYRQQKFCGIPCKAEYQRKAALERFNTALADTGVEGLPKHIARNGYVRISVPSLVTGRKQTIFEHRFVMERHLGRALLTDETVHHVNGNRQDNRLENLELFSSRHGPGQRVVDKIDFAIEMLQRYPEFARRAGFTLVAVEGEDDH